MISFDLSFFFGDKKKNFQNNNIYKKNLSKAIECSKVLKSEIKNNSNEILLSFTKKYQKELRKLKHNIDFANKKKVVIGLGGSSSGAKALSYYINDEIVYFDNLDYSYLFNFLKKEKLENHVFFAISKSGDTFETLAILNLIISFAKKIGYTKIFENIFAITEKKNSFLKSFIEQNNINYIEHNPKIGGRFSVLSETGMLPFFDLPIKVEDSSEKYLKLLDDYENDMSPVKNCAVILTCMQEYKLNIYCNLLYNYKLKHFSYWFHQLHAESLGKNQCGLTPITSICPKDHHSMMQLYIDGPRDKLFNIFSPQDKVYFKNFDQLGFKNIEKYSPFDLLDRQFKATSQVFLEKNIPHRIINVSQHNNADNILELFAYFLLETILLGNMMKINPYDQPAVQLIKNKI